MWWLLIAIEGDYSGPKLDPEGKVTVEFTEQLMATYKEQQKLHRRYAYQVFHKSVVFVMWPRFLPCDTMCKLGLCCRPVSLRLSVTFHHSIQMAEDVVKLLCRPSSPITLVFWPPMPVPSSNGTPSAGAQNTKGVGKFCDFRLKAILD